VPSHCWQLLPLMGGTDQTISQKEATVITICPRGGNWDCFFSTVWLNNNPLIYLIQTCYHIHWHRTLKYKPLTLQSKRQLADGFMTHFTRRKQIGRPVSTAVVCHTLTTQNPRHMTARCRRTQMQKCKHFFRQEATYYLQ